MEEYAIKIENYNGPLDLLLDLIKEKKMDIFSINLAELATAYVTLINQLMEKNFDLASEYLVMAATLINIKAGILLSDSTDKVKSEKEKHDLLKKLTELHKYRLMAGFLKNHELSRRLIHVKNPIDYNLFQLPIDESKLDGHSNLLAIVVNLRKMFERTHYNNMREAFITTFNLSPAERREEIIEIIKMNGEISYKSVFTVPSINHFVVTMLTVLDMSRRGELVLGQEEQYGLIDIRKGVIGE